MAGGKSMGRVGKASALGVALFALTLLPAQQAAAQVPDLAIPAAPVFENLTAESSGEYILTDAVLRLEATITNVGTTANNLSLSVYRIQGDTALAASAPPSGISVCAADTTALCREFIAASPSTIFGNGSDVITVSRFFPESTTAPRFPPPSELGLYQYYACATDTGESASNLSDNCSPSVAARVAAPSPDVPGDGSTTVRLDVPGMFDGTIDDFDDQDAFLVALVVGGTYQFDAVATGSSTLDTALGVYPPGHGNFVGNPSCNLATGFLAGNDDIGGGNSDSRFTYTATQTGDHVLCVDAFGGAGNSMASSGDYRLTATVTTEPPSQDVPGDGSTTIRLDVPGTLTGTIDDADDQDAFLVALIAGGTYQFDAERTSGNLDTSLGLYPPGHGNFAGSDSCHNATGVRTGNDDNGLGGNDSRITWMAAQTGDHVLCVDAFGDSSDSQPTSGDYRLTAAVTSEPPSADADLSIGTLTSSQTSVRISDPDFTLTATVTNAGSVAPAGSVFVDFYRDITDRREFGAFRATRVQEVEITTLTASGGAVPTFAAVGSITPDRERTPRTIYYFACIRTDDNDLSLCTATVAVKLQEASGPFLFFTNRIEGVPSDDQIIGVDTSFTGSIAVQNRGDVDTSGAVAVDIYQVRQTAANEIPPLPNDLSTLTAVASGDAQGLGSVPPRILSNNNGPVDISIPVPSTPGVYYYYQCIRTPPPPPHPTARETCGDTLPSINTPEPLTVVFGVGVPVFAGDQANPFTHIFAPGDTVNLTLPEASRGNGALRYALIPRSGVTPADLGLVFDHTATPGTLIGTISDSAVPQTSEFTYRVQDADGDTSAGDRSNLTLFITIDGAPSFGASTTIPPLAYTVGTAVRVTLPTATGGNGALTYAIVEPLPDGLAFAAGTRVLSGTPTTGQSATDYTYTATDSDATNPDSVELTFSITIITSLNDATLTATNPDPLVENTLNGATLEVTLTGVTYANSLNTLDFVVSALNLAANALTLDSVVRDSATQATLTLAHTGADFDAEGRIRVSVLGSAHTGSGVLQAGSVSVTAIVENNDASLSALALSGGASLAPAFAAGTLAYTATVANSVTDIMVTPTATNDFATITVNGNAVANGTASAAITLPVDTTNDITILVTATDGATTQTYTLAVTRPAVAPPPDVPGDGTTTVRLAVPGTLDGTIDPASDQDAFLVALVSGGIYQIDAEAMGGSLDPGTALFPPGQAGLGDCSGFSSGVLISDDDGGSGTDSRIAYTAAQTGDHVLCVRSFNSTSGNYRLTAAVTTAPPSVAADLSIGTLTSSQTSVRVSDLDFTLTATVTNAGSVAPTGSVFVDFYRDIVDRRAFGAFRATRVQEVEITTLTASGGAVPTFAAVGSITPDRERTPRTIYYFACIRTDDNDLGLCTATVAVNLQEASGPFLFFTNRIEGVPSDDQIIGVDTSFTGSIAVQNRGDVDTSGAVAVDIYQVRQTAANEIPPLPNDLSTLTAVASGDAQGLGSVPPRILSNNNGPLDITIPVPSTPGVYYYYQCIRTPPPPPHPTARETCGDTLPLINTPEPLTVVFGVGVPVFAGDQANPFTHIFAPGDTVNLTLPEASRGNGALRYALIPRSGVTPADLGLVFDHTATPGTLIGTISDSAVPQTSEFTYRVQDADGDTSAGDRSNLTLFITIDGAPSFGASTTIPPLAYTVGTAVRVTLPTATGGNGALTYAIVEPLPDGLAFAAGTRVLSGTPTTGQSATDYTYTATDSDATNPDSVELTFSITIITSLNDATLTATNPDPLVENTLNGATLEVTLTGVTYANSLNTLDFVVSALNLAANALTLDSVVRDSATQATLTLAHTGADFDAEGRIRVSVLGSAHTGSGVLQAGSVSVTAIVENNDASLSALALSGGASLAPAFAAGTLAYTATVANSVTDIMVTPTATNDFATITVNGNAVANGTASAAITLPVDTTTDITILVSATDGATTQTYTLAVTRLAAPPPDITARPIATGANEVTVIFSAPVNVAASGEANFASSALNKGMATSDERWLFFGVVPTEPTTIEPNADGTAVIITLLRFSGDDILPAPLLPTGSFISLTPKNARTAITAATGPARVIGFSVRLMPADIDFTGTFAGAVTEDTGPNTATGTVAAADAGNGNDVDLLPTTATGTYGDFTIGADGRWTYTLNNADADTNALPGADPGQTATDTFRVNSAAGGRQEIVITITGANDPPVAAISAPTEGMQVDFGSMVTLTATGTDPDTGQTATLTYAWTANPNVGSFADATAEDTTWTAPASGAVPVTLTLTVMDDATPPRTGTAQVTVNPVAVAITFGGATTGDITEGATTPITGNLTVASSGSNTNVVAQTAVSGTFGTFAIDANGRWTYTLDNTNSAINPLAAGATLDDPFTVTAAANAAATVVVTITITGVNDPPTVEITAPATNGMQVDFNSVVTLTATGTDPDTGQTATLSYQWSASPNVGSFANATAEDTTWTVPASGTAPVTLTLTATDNANATGTAQVIVNPTAVAVDFGGTLTGGVTEGDTTPLTGTLTATIRSSGAGANVVIQTNQPGTYGMFSIDATGNWTYTLDNNNADTNALPAGDEQPDTFTVTASANAAATVNVIITITGANDAPTAEITAPPANTMVSFAGTITVTGTGTDPDTGDNANLTYLWSTTPAGQGSFANPAIASTTWTAPSTERSVTLNLMVSDDTTPPGTDTAMVTVMVVPVAIIGDTTGAVTEDGALTATGDLNIDNPAGNTNFMAVNRDGTYGAFRIATNGNWTYTLDNANAAVQALAAGAAPTETFTATSAIGGGTQVITITVNGANDAPTADISAPAAGNVEFGVAIPVTGTGTDPDTGTTLGYAWTTNPAGRGSFANANVASTMWTAPAAGGAVTLILTVSDDATPPATGRAQVRVTPVAPAVTFGSGGTTGTVTEDAGTTTATGQLTLTTNSNDKNVVVQNNAPGRYGDFTIGATGNWTYTLDNADTDTNALAAGATPTETFSVVASANPAATVNVIITITGANDAPTAEITAPPANTMVSFAGTITVTGTGTDPDTGDNANLTYAWTTTPAGQGSFANPAIASTTWTAPSTERSVTLNLMVSDDTTPPGTNTAMVAVMVVPVAIIGDTTGAVTEDGALTATGDLNIDNPAGNTNFMAVNTDGTYGAFRIATNGNWTYTLDNANAAVQALAAGDAPTETFTATSAIGGGTQVITITVNGANDAPTADITAPAPNAQVEFGDIVPVTGTGTDPDTGQTATLTYAWRTQPAGRGSFANASAASTTWTAPATGTANVILILEVSDGTATDTARVTVRPRAAPVTIAGGNTGSVTEDGATTATGTLTVTNPNPAPGDSTAVLAPTERSRYGAFAIVLATGVWTYTLDNADPDTDALAAAASVMETFTIRTAADPSVTRVVTITITGANDAPTARITAPTPPMAGTFSVVSGRPVTLRGEGEDVDTGQTATLTYAWTANPNTGSFANADRRNTTWDTPTVASGTLTVTLTLTVDDGTAETAANFVLIVTEQPSVTGNGVGPLDGTGNTATASILAPVTLDADGNVASGGTATGTLTVANIPTDGGSSTHRVTREPMYGTVTIGGTMTLQISDQAAWTYTLDNRNPVVQALGPGDTLDPDSFDVRTTVAGITINSTISVSFASEDGGGTPNTFPDDPPTATARINDRAGARGTVDEGAMVTLTADATDPDSDDNMITYQWAHVPPQIVTFDPADGRGPTVTFLAPEERTTLRFTLTATSEGVPGELDVTVQVGRGSERALQKTLAAFGRAFATGTVSIFEDHLSTPARTNTSNFTIGGHKFDMATTTPSAAVGTGRDLSALATPPSFPNDRKTGSDSDRLFHRIGNPVEHAQAQPDLANTINSANLASTTPNGATTSDDATATTTTTTTLMSGQDLLMQSAFHLNLHDATATAASGWSFWGRATTGNFDGDTESETADAGEKISVDGSVDSGYLGIDYLTPAGTRLGLAIAQSNGEIDYDEVTGGNTTSGDLEAKLTSILPYIQWQPSESTNAWLLLGYGTGDAELATDGDAETTDVDIEMQMIALGRTGDLTTGKRSEWSWKASAFAVELESEADEETDLPAVDADSQRLRAAIQGRLPGQVFTPNWELGIRWDDGNAEQGTGADVGLGFDYHPPGGLTIQAKAGALVAHEEEDYAEWNATLHLRYDPGAQGRGVTFTLQPGWTKDGRSQKMGMDFSNALGKWSKRELRLELTGERTERDDNNIGHNIRLTGSLRF